MHTDVTGPPTDYQGSELLDLLDDALVTVRQLSRTPAYLGRLLAGVDIPGGTGTLRVLRAVERSDRESPSIGEVAAALALDPSTTSRMVERCVTGGLLTREPHPGDRRRSHLRLTPRGARMLAAATKNRRDLLAEVTHSWAPAELERLLVLLDRLNDAFDRIEPR